jgi:hypothetical protein
MEAQARVAVSAPTISNASFSDRVANIGEQ